MRFLLLHAKIYPLPLLRHNLQGERVSLVFPYSSEGFFIAFLTIPSLI